jgi:hypothetical protein
MKKFLLIFSSLFCITLSSQNFPAGDLFYTAGFGIVERTAWWHEGLELPQKKKFIQAILNVVDSGRVDVYAPEFPYTKKLERKEVQQLLHEIDTVQYDYGYLTGDEFFLTRYDLPAENIVSISFYEKWEYDGGAKTFVKNVKGIILNARLYKGPVEPMGTPLFYIPFDGKGIKPGPPVADPPVIPKMTSDFHTRDLYHVVLPADVLFRDDTTQQKKNQRIAKKIIGEMLSGKKTVYYDTIYPYNKPLNRKVVAKNFPAYQAATTFQFMEDWKVDLNRMTFQKTVYGIVLEKEAEYKSVEYLDERQKILFTRLAFLPLNGYIPTPFSPFEPKVASGFVTRQIFFKSPLVYEKQTITTDSAALMKMCIGLCGLVESQTLPAYTYAMDGAPAPWSKENLTRLFAEAHKENIPPERYMVPSYDSLPFYYQTTGGMLFTENWIYNSAAQTFEKQIDSLTLLRAYYIMIQEGYFNQPFFTVAIPAVKDPAAIMKPGFLVAKNIQSPVIIDYFYSPTQFAGNYYASDMVYLPHGFYRESLMENSVRYNFIQQIINDGLAGKTVIYAGENSQTVLSPSQFRARLDSIESDTVHADLPSDYLKFQKIIFVEDWYFDPSTGAFCKKVNEIIFVNSTNYFTPAQEYTENDRRVFSIKLK